MSDLFAGVDNSAKTVAEKDSVRGARRQPIPSSIQNFIIKYAYADKSKGGAMGINLALTVFDGDHKDREVRLTEWITSGDAKGNKTYYERKTDKGVEHVKLPGFVTVDNLCQIVAGKSVLEMGSSKKTISLYDFDKKAEVPTEVDMLDDLVGKPVSACVLHTIEDKNAKNAQTGEYEPTGQVREINTIDKFLDPKDRKTASELDNGVDADFHKAWLAKWEGQINDQSTEVQNAGLKGAPQASGSAAPKENLFG